MTTPDRPATRQDAARSLARIVKASTGFAMKVEVAEEILARVVEPIYDAAVAEGRRQATDGWIREWQVEMPGADWVPIDDEQVPHLADWPQRSRLVGPWERGDHGDR